MKIRVPYFALLILLTVFAVRCARQPDDSPNAEAGRRKAIEALEQKLNTIADLRKTESSRRVDRWTATDPGLRGFIGDYSKILAYQKLGRAKKEVSDLILGLYRYRYNPPPNEILNVSLSGYLVGIQANLLKRVDSAKIESSKIDFFETKPGSTAVIEMPISAALEGAMKQFNEDGGVPGQRGTYEMSPFLAAMKKIDPVAYDKRLARWKAMSPVEWPNMRMYAQMYELIDFQIRLEDRFLKGGSLEIPIPKNSWAELEVDDHSRPFYRYVLGSLFTIIGR